MESVDGGEGIDAAYLDFSKAFDHNITGFFFRSFGAMESVKLSWSASVHSYSNVACTFIAFCPIRPLRRGTGSTAIPRVHKRPGGSVDVELFYSLWAISRFAEQSYE